jgi:hypothetical protein
MAENSMNEPGKPRLVPARPPALEDAGYLPRLPWRYIGLTALVLGLVLASYGYRQNQKAAELRVSILQKYEGELAAPRATMSGTRDKLNLLISDAAAHSGTDSIVAPNFKLSDLRAGNGLYMRISLQNAHDKQHIIEAAKLMEPDWIPSCLGLSPTTAREIYEVGEFLMPEFVANLENENVMKLRVRQDTMERRAQSDMQKLLAAAQSHWFMLVLQEGESRHDQPVRVFIWDLATQAPLLFARVQSHGILLTSHILSQGVDAKAQPALGDRSRAAANDCSLAGSLKKIAASSTAH